MRLAQMLRVYRAHHGIEQRAVAEEMGIAQNVLSGLERGSMPTTPNFLRVLLWLLGDELAEQRANDRVDESPNLTDLDVPTVQIIDTAEPPADKPEILY